MPDLSKHPILHQISEVIHAIEICGASPALTNAVCKASALYEPAFALVDAKSATLDAVAAVVPSGTPLLVIDDAEIERQVLAAGLDVAPRVTPEQIDALMARVVYTFDERPNGSTVTFAHALLDGTFFVATGMSACVSPENYNSEIGRNIAMSNAARAARDKLWELEGYRLRATMLTDAEFVGGSMAITD